MAEQAIEKLPILPGNMNTNRPTWDNMRYLLRNVHHAQIFVNHKRVKQNLKGLGDIHTLVLRLLGVPPAVYLEPGRQLAVIWKDISPRHRQEAGLIAKLRSKKCEM